MKTDKEIMNQIKAHLDTHPVLSHDQSTVYILIHDGNVVLSGQVNSEERHQLIQQVIGTITGVGEFTDEIIVGDGSQHRHSVDIDWGKGQMDVN